MSGSLPNPQLSSVEYIGSTSGTITVQAPAIAGSGTLTLPVINAGTISAVLTGTTGSIGGSALTPGAVSTGTVAIAGATTLMAVETTPQTYPGNSAYWHGYVSSTGTVTVAVGVVNSGTPAATAYNVRVIT